MAAFNADGFVVSVNDQVTIMGSASVIIGSGGTAVVSVLPLMSASTFNANANDMQSLDGPQDASHLATSVSGAFFGVGDRVSVQGTVTSISGSGANAVLTVKLCTSGLSITTPAGSVHSAQFNG